MNDKFNLDGYLPFSKTLKILYVEDNEPTREQFLKFIENIFGTIVVACDGREALEKFHNNSIDIIISDINMPHMDGIELLQRIREIDKSIPFIAISAYSDSKYFVDMIKLSVDGFVLKPMEMFQFLDLITKVVKKIKDQRDKVKYESELKNLNNELEKTVIKRTSQLNSKYYFDDLTKLGNRNAFFYNLNLCLSESPPTTFLINIDSFHIYNELYGMNIGNEILIEFAVLLKEFALKNNLAVYRVSGDEFVLFEFQEYIQFTKCEKLLYDLLDTIDNNPLYIKSIDDKIKVDVTVGISFCIDNPLAKAVTALKNAKNNQKRFGAYNSEIDNQKHLQNTLYWKKEIETALKEDRVVPYFQPIVDADKKIVKYETLVRIKQIDQNGNINIISPADFIDIAKKTKQYNTMSCRVIQKSAELIKNKNISLSMNLNIKDFYHRDLVPVIKEALTNFNEANKDNDNSIILEVLESDEIRDYELFKEYLLQFKELGAEIAIDDFGTGYSNLSHIMGISPTYVKFDGSLVTKINNHQESYEIIKAIVNFAKIIGIKTIAKYVTSKEIFDILVDLGVDEFQGYYFGKPVSIKEIR